MWRPATTGRRHGHGRCRRPPRSPGSGWRRRRRGPARQSRYGRPRRVGDGRRSAARRQMPRPAEGAPRPRRRQRRGPQSHPWRTHRTAAACAGQPTPRPALAHLRRSPARARPAGARRRRRYVGWRPRREEGRPTHQTRRWVGCSLHQSRACPRLAVISGSTRVNPSWVRGRAGERGTTPTSPRAAV